MQEIPPTQQPEIESSPAPAPQTLPVQLWSVLVLVAFVLGLGAGYLIWAMPQKSLLAEAEQKVALAEQKAAAAQTSAAGTSANAADQNPSVTVPEQVKRYPVPIDDDPIYGNKDAPITIIEFSDYECPYCKRWHQDAWPQIKAKYGDKVRLVYRDFPLESIHPDAVPAAEAADCAGEQGHYWEFNDLAFSGQKPLGPDTYNAYAEQIGLNMDSFKQCVSERRYKDEVQNDLKFATELGVRSTPTFFVNGLAVVGAQPFEVFQQIIDLELAGKIPK